MPELDPFDIRLEGAVHAFADAAQTRVDAADTAERAIRRGRAGRLSWLGVAVPVPASILVLLLLLVLALAVSLGIGAAWNRQGLVVPAVLASPTAVPGSPTPGPSGDGEGDEVVAGTESFTLSIPDAKATAVVTSYALTSDPRAAGTGTWELTADLRSGAGPAWGTFRLENARGTWEGTCTGSLWRGGAGGARSCLLVGSGDYIGYSYNVVLTWSDDGPDDVRGVIYPGSSPVP